MSTVTAYRLTALCGILGTAALVVYYSAPFWLMPLPPPNATVDQVAAFGAQYHDIILWDTWLQAAGSALAVLFVLALVHLAGAESTFAGRLTPVVGTVILGLALIEGATALAAIQAGATGHPEFSVAFIDLNSVFVHVFTIAPSLFLTLGFALRGTRLLPNSFAGSAIALGVAFQVLGVVGLFVSSVLLAVILVLLAQQVWTLAAAVALGARREGKADGVVQL
jgi:hypothetical protein